MKILITSTDSMAIQFLLPHINHLVLKGYDVTLACSEVKGRIDELKSKLPKDVVFNKVSLKRNPFKISNFKGLRELKKIINDNKFDLVWTNEPVMGVMTRLASKKARKKGTKVLYMCHGFHFYKGGPKSGWLLWYPIEKLMAKYTDVLVTINNQDFEFSKSHFTKCMNYKIDGIGLDTSRFTGKKDETLRERFNIGNDDIILISVGELNKNKNQQIIIKALNKLNDKKYHYVMCGIGDQKENLLSLAKEYGLENNIHFTGYINNVPEVLSASDIFVFPSLREGFGLAVVEGMLSGLPVVVSNSVRGKSDFIIDGETGFSVSANDEKAFAEKIELLATDEILREKISCTNKEFAQRFTLDKIKKQIEEIVKGIN